MKNYSESFAEIADSYGAKYSFEPCEKSIYHNFYFSDVDGNNFVVVAELITHDGMSKTFGGDVSCFREEFVMINWWSLSVESWGERPDMAGSVLRAVRIIKSILSLRQEMMPGIQVVIVSDDDDGNGAERHRRWLRLFDGLMEEATSHMDLPLGFQEEFLRGESNFLVANKGYWAVRPAMLNQ
jgi:hypothetical protein